MRELYSYKEFIKSLSKNNSNRTFLNSDRDHGVAVLVELFKKAKSEVRIFAGNLCKPINGVPNIGEDSEYIVALSEFIEKGGKLLILLNNFDEKCAMDSNLYKRLAYYIDKGKNIQIKGTKASPYRDNDPDKKEVHFTIGDLSSYRIETDTEKRTAECNLNNEELSKAYADFFDKIFDDKESKVIDIKKIFYNAD